MHYPCNTGAAAPKPEVTSKAGQGLLVSGDNVRIQLDVDVFKAMQDGHGGWNDSMADVSALLRIMGLIVYLLLCLTPACVLRFSRKACTWKELLKSA